MKNLHRTIRIVLPLLLLLTLTLPPSALGQNMTSKPATADPNQDVSYIRLSAELAAVARDTNDAVLMLAAANLEAMAVTEDAQHEKVAQDGEADVEAKAEGPGLFELAQEYAGSNDQLLAMVADTKAMASATTKGRRGGAAEVYDRVLARRTDVWRIVFRGRELAEVCVVGDGDTDLDLYVYDEGGNLICSDTGYTDRAYCSWTPRWTGPFEIEIENLGGVYNRYRLATN